MSVIVGPRPMHAGLIAHRQRSGPELLEQLMSGTLGADVSEFQSVNWQAYGAARSFAIARTSFGMYRADNAWAANKTGSRAHVRLRGFYQFLCADQDPVAQAKYHVSLTGPLEDGEFDMLDWEDYPATGGLPTIAQAQAWCDYVEQARSRASWVYSAGAQPSIGRRRVIASYGAQPAAGWTIWQYTDGEAGDMTGEPVPGIGNCDQNVYPGTADALAALIGGSPTPSNEEDDMAAYILSSAGLPAQLVNGDSVQGLDSQATEAAFQKPLSLPTVTVDQSTYESIVQNSSTVLLPKILAALASLAAAVAALGQAQGTALSAAQQAELDAIKADADAIRAKTDKDLG